MQVVTPKIKIKVLTTKKTEQGSSGGGNSKSPMKATMMVHTVEPPPFLDISLPSATVLNYFINLLLYIPSLVHLRPRTTIHNVEEEDLTQMAVKDSFLLWTHVLVLIGGSVTPVLHLMTDEALSSLGLDMLRTNKSCNPLQLCNQTCCADRDRDEGHTNEACDEPL